MESSVLFKSADGAAVVIDIPRSLEEAQVLSGQDIKRRIVSAHPRETPWQTPEPKKGGSTAQYVPPSAAVAELMTLESVKAALEVIRAEYDGPWCLPRVTRKRADVSEPTSTDAVGSQKSKHELLENKEVTSTNPYIPEESHHLLGTVESEREAFIQTAPQFDLIVLDPPWPSRSVKRKSNSYIIVHSTEDARDLLAQIPVAAHLKRDGLVAIWITNKAAITELLTTPGGVFAQWGLEPVGEWIWLKVTSAGEPILDIESAWRKPWERLLIARKIGSRVSLPINRRVILGVPDVHSRKPNLRGIFEDIFHKDYMGLEVFARNLTAGWWSWGNEVLFFQERHHWVPLGEEEQEEEGAVQDNEGAS
ncbi:MT-A70-domain-containing protein [Xylaria sp. FL0064]|nr:MT-A70-domain-containing protein [Xylaria sp. FL0064]